MEQFSLIAEVIALLLIAVLLLSYVFYNKFSTQATVLFRNCLLIAAISIVWDMVCVGLLWCGDIVPIWVDWFVNTIYYWLQIVMGAVITWYVFHKLLEHVHDDEEQIIVRRVLVGIVGFFTILLVINFSTGILFYMDGSGVYQQGILNRLGYVSVIIETVLVVKCYMKYRGQVGKESKHAITLFMPVVIGLVVIQIANPHLLLNGLLAAFMNLILFISFFRKKEDNDAVTGLGNRDSFFLELGHRVKTGEKFQILLVVPTNFTAVNQRFGHQMGNEFLYTIAGWLEDRYEEASIFRYIGVTFALIIPYVDAGTARRHVRNIERRFEQPWEVGDAKIWIHASLGDVYYEYDAKGENQMMEILDYLLSRTKHTTTKYVHFDEVMAEKFLWKTRVANRLIKSLEQKLLEVWYQPIYSTGDEKCHVAEALVRMRGESGSYIPPGEFVPIAEERGMARELFWQVLENVCRYLNTDVGAKWESISVNMSIDQFEEVNLISKIERILASYAVSPEKIKFEITERMLAEHPKKARQMIERMEKRGFRFYLDDFGIGYSNFASVLQYHFECIKLDRSLIQKIENDDKVYQIVSGLIHIFNHTDMRVVVEGVETGEQAELLKQFNVERIQGYYYARPMPMAKLEEFMKSAIFL